VVGRVHSIDTFSTLDGPGIRTVVFMQGCLLRCQYCQNPDTWDPAASTAREYSTQEIMKVILRNVPYFNASGGGLTISGGEPLLQTDFIKEIFAECQKQKVHTAIDTSLYVAEDKVLAVLPFTELFLADIKHMNKAQSHALVGAGNGRNLKNIQLINDQQVEIWIRYVVVPGLTDMKGDILALAEFIAPLASITRLDLLPYHSLGKHKWKLLGLKYQLEDVEPPSYEYLQRLKELIETESGKKVYIPI
jgi:pyruvate formate lyase activating enzyme